MSGPPQGIEPPTTGRVILNTGRGPLEFELWCKEAPIACHNFLQRCSEGYYDGSTFHRVVRNFIVQGGIGWRDNDSNDPSESGKGSKGFPDEFHTRLKFSKRGILGTANIDGVRNSNGSQFIISLAAEGAPSLNRKNTVFGRITPQTIYTLVEIGTDVETVGKPGEDGDDVPLYPVKIINAEIVEPYFDDIEAKKSGTKDVKENEEKKLAKKKPLKVKQKVKMNYGNDEDEEEGMDAGPDKKRKFQIKAPISVPSKKKKKAKTDADEHEEKKESDITQTEPIVKEKTLKSEPIVEPEKSESKEDFKPPGFKDEIQAIRDIKAETEGVSQFISSRLEEKSASELESEFLALKNSIKKQGDSGKPQQDRYQEKNSGLRKIDGYKDVGTEQVMDMSKYFKSKSKKTKSKGSASRESETLALLQKFNSRLKEAPSSSTLHQIPESKGSNAKASIDDELNEAGSGLSEEEDRDPFDLYSHRFGGPYSTTISKSDGKSGDDDRAVYEGIRISKKDAALIRQDDKNNRRSAKYGMADPENRLKSGGGRVIR